MHINTKFLNNKRLIERRISKIIFIDQGVVRTALEYLYLMDGPKNLPRNRLKRSLRYLDDAEKIVICWLYTRTNGSARNKYGHNALIAVKISKYRCAMCGYKDVRTFNLDHENGRDDKSKFNCLCVNCHAIKSRRYDWTGSK